MDEPKISFIFISIYSRWVWIRTTFSHLKKEKRRQISWLRAFLIWNFFFFWKIAHFFRNNGMICCSWTTYPEYLFIFACHRSNFACDWETKKFPHEKFERWHANMKRYFGYVTWTLISLNIKYEENRNAPKKKNYIQLSLFKIQIQFFFL